MSSRAQLPLWPLYLALGAGLVWWNTLPFRERGLYVRTKELSFLPDPLLGRAMAVGQCGAAAKLRWIDSFQYFALQLDRRDDRLANGESAFRRLYDLLIAQDPLFEPLYQHAAFNTGALSGRHDIALGYLLRGVTELPSSTVLWRQAAAELLVNFDLERRQPHVMEAFLDAWADSEGTENGRRLVWDWKAAMARRSARGVEQLPYWLDQYATAKPGSPTARFVESAIRDQLARHALALMSQLMEAHAAVRGYRPALLDELLTVEVLRHAWPRGLPPYAPVVIEGGRARLRPDPFGYPYLLADGEVTSLGVQRARAESRVPTSELQLAAAARDHGRWAKNATDAAGMGVTLPQLPLGADYRIVNDDIRIEWPAPPEEPWRIGR